jgi:hypothetical protein
LQENGSLLSSAFPRLCLSRACLGKLKVVGVLVYNSFSIKWRNEDVFRTCTADVIGRGIVIFTLLGSATPLPPDNARNFQRNDAQSVLRHSGRPPCEFSSSFSSARSDGSPALTVSALHGLPTML